MCYHSAKTEDINLQLETHHTAKLGKKPKRGEHIATKSQRAEATESRQAAVEFTSGKVTSGTDLTGAKYLTGRRKLSRKTPKIRPDGTGQ